MERIQLIRKSQRNKRLETKILNGLTINESGFVIYPGKGPEIERTGSPAQLLIDWFLYKNGTEKPLDFDIFANHMKQLKI